MRFNKNISLYIYCFLAVLFFSAVFTNVVHATAQGEKIKIGYLKNYGTILQPAEYNRYGYGYEYFNEIARYTGWEYEYIACEWAEGLQMLHEGKIDIFGPLQKTLERSSMYLYPDRPMGYEYGVMYVHKDKNINYEDWKALDGLVVATMPGNYYTEVFGKMYRQNGIAYNTVVDTLEQIENKLNSGRYDVFVVSGLIDVDNTKIVGKSEAEPFYYAMKKGNERQLAELNHALTMIQKESPYFEVDLHRKYYEDKMISRPSYSKDDQELIKKYPRLTVGYELDMPPSQFFNSQLGSADGFVIKVMDEISRESGINFDYVPIDYSKANLLDEVDLLVSVGRDRINDQVRLTKTYHTIPMLLVGKHFNYLSDNLKVAILNRDMSYYNSIKIRYPNFNLQECNNMDELVDKLNSQKVDFALVSLYDYDEIARREGYRRFNTFPIDIPIEAKIAISGKLPPEMVHLLNKTISRIPKNKIDSIVFSNTLGREYKVAVKNILTEYSSIVITIAIFVVSVLLALVAYIIRNNKINRENLQQVAFVDEVTGLASMQKFKLDVQRALATAQPGEYTISLLDIDKFKYLNDSVGFEAGNEVLKIIGDYFVERATPSTYVSRQNADNFVFFYKTEDKKFLFNAQGQMQIIMKSIRAVLGENFTLTFSLGHYTIRDTKQNLSSMIDCANIAKKSVKNVYGHSEAEFTDDMQAILDQRRYITLSMEQALNDMEFVPYIQPKFSLKTGKMVGAEILTRWVSPIHGIVSPISFIPLFEKNGFIRKLDLYMYNKTCEFVRQLQDRGIEDIPQISFNVSRATLRHKEFLKTLIDTAKYYNVATRYLEIELTESLFLDNVNLTYKVLAALKAQGFWVSIDDFGSGYSSLSLLKDLQVDIVKIDKAFLDETLYSQKGQDIINAIITMAQKLNLQTVAEGVECIEQVQSLQEMGCDIAQGYYFARPMPISDFEKTYFPEKKD